MLRRSNTLSVNPELYPVPEKMLSVQNLICSLRKPMVYYYSNSKYIKDINSVTDSMNLINANS